MPKRRLSVLKRIRQNEKRYAHNKKYRSQVKTLVKKARLSISRKLETAPADLLRAIKTLDKTAQKGIIKKNTANRKKSRLQKQFNQLFKETK